jgi:hypothetical protein
MGMMPSSGKNVRGINAVTGIGADSVIHQVIIHNATASVFTAGRGKGIHRERSNVIRQNAGPRMKATDRYI